MGQKYIDDTQNGNESDRSIIWLWNWESLNIPRTEKVKNKDVYLKISERKLIFKNISKKKERPCIPFIKHIIKNI